MASNSLEFYSSQSSEVARTLKCVDDSRTLVLRVKQCLVRLLILREYSAGFPVAVGRRPCLL